MSTQLRADARRNRAALIEAARTVFAERGVMVPLEEVANAAQVGRGTLYRHFADRTALICAVYEDTLAGHEQFVSDRASDPQVVPLLLDRVSRAQLRLQGLFPYLVTADDGAEGLAAIVADTRALFDRVLPVSQEAGVIRPEVTTDDLLLVLYMVEGALTGSPGEAADAARARCLELVMPSLLTADGLAAWGPHAPAA